MTQGKTLHLTEGLWITATAPDRLPLTSTGGGGGGPGYGGWGLSTGVPRGTSAPPTFVRDPGWRSVFGEEKAGQDSTFDAAYAPNRQQLPAKIEEERSSIKNQANRDSSTSSHAVQLQQQLTTRQLIQKRDEYLKTFSVATGFYGAIPFYKRYDSFTSRLNDPGAFELTNLGEAWGRRVWVTYSDSVDAAHQLHSQAVRYQAMSNDLPELARRVDEAEPQSSSSELIAAIERRITQIHIELQICLNCLPNFVQHELIEGTPPQDSDSLTQILSSYSKAARGLIASKQAATPSFASSNPNIVGPLSKPQVEALQHLADDQRTGRAGPLWKEYHQALSLTESVRFLELYAKATESLAQRAAEVETLQTRLTALNTAAEEAERLAAEAEYQRREALRQSITYTNQSRLAASAPVITPVGAATFAIAEAAYKALTTSIAQALSRVAILAQPLAVGTLAMAWPSSLGNSDRRYLISTPLATLTPPGVDLASLALSSSSIDLPYFLAGVETENELGLYVVPGGKPVQVLAATFDTERQVYSLALDNPQRILTWTPVSAPGGEEGSSTSLPPAPSGTIVYTGSSLNPMRTEQESYPALDLDQERLIITFPADSGLPPLLVVFKSPRYEPGIASGEGTAVTGVWLGEAARGAGAPIPAQIADQLRGREYKDFNAFRKDFWRTVANDEVLSRQFSAQNLSAMKNTGTAPYTPASDHYLAHKKFILHHVIPISKSGAVYDVDNIEIVTPQAHHRIHYGNSQ